MAADRATFIVEFPEFEEMNTLAPEVLDRALRDAQRMVGQRAWGVRWQDGVFVKTAELLALTAFGENMRLRGQLASPYGEMYKQMQRSLGLRFGLSGGVD